MNELKAMGSATVNPVYYGTMRERVAAAIRDNWEAALDVGCMDHGGYDWLVDAVMLAVRDEPAGPDAVAAAFERGLAS